MICICICILIWICIYIHINLHHCIHIYIYRKTYYVFIFSLHIHFIHIYILIYVIIWDMFLFFAFWGLEDQSFPLSLGQRPSSSRSPGRNTIEAHVGRVQGSGEQTFRLQMSILPRICLYFWVRKGGFHSLKGSSLLSWVDYGAMSAVRCFGICCGCCGSSGCCRFCGWSSSACSLHTFSLVADNLGSFLLSKVSKQKLSAARSLIWESLMLGHVGKSGIEMKLRWGFF